MNNKVKVFAVIVVTITILSGCTGCSQPINPQITQQVINPTAVLSTPTDIPTNTYVPTSTVTRVPTNTLQPTNTPIPTDAPTPTITSTPTPLPRMWTYDERRIFWSQSGAGVILYFGDYIPDPLIPYEESTTPEELWSWEIPADYLCQWLFTQIVSGTAFPDVADRETVWKASADWLGHVGQEPYCPQFDLEEGFNP